MEKSGNYYMIEGLYGDCIVYQGRFGAPLGMNGSTTQRVCSYLTLNKATVWIPSSIPDRL